MVHRLKDRELVPNSCDPEVSFLTGGSNLSKSSSEKYTNALSLLNLSSESAKSVFRQAINDECFGVTAAVPVFSWIKKRCGGSISSVDPFYLRELLLHISSGGIHSSGHLNLLYYEAVASRTNIKILEDNPDVVDAFLVGLSKFSDRRNFDQLWAFRLSKHPEAQFDLKIAQMILKNVIQNFDRTLASLIRSDISFIQGNSELSRPLSSGSIEFATKIRDALAHSNLRLAAHLVRDEFPRESKIFSIYRNQLTSLYFNLGTRLRTYCDNLNVSVKEGLEHLKKVQLERPIPLQDFKHGSILDACLNEQIFMNHGLHLINAPFYEDELKNPSCVFIRLPGLSMGLPHVSYATVALDCIGRSQNPTMHALLDDFMGSLPANYLRSENVHISYWEALCRLGRIEDAVRSFERYFDQSDFIQPSTKAIVTIWSFTQKSDADSNLIKEWHDRLHHFTPGQRINSHRVVKAKNNNWRVVEPII